MSWRWPRPPPDRNPRPRKGWPGRTRPRFLAQFPAALKQAARRVSIKALGFNGPVVLSGPVAGVALALAGLGAVGASWLAYELGERSGYERGMLAALTNAAPNPKPAAPAAH